MNADRLARHGISLLVICHLVVGLGLYFADKVWCLLPWWSDRTLPTAEPLSSLTANGLCYWNTILFFPMLIVDICARSHSRRGQILPKSLGYVFAATGLACIGFYPLVGCFLIWIIVGAFILRSHNSSQQQQEQRQEQHDSRTASESATLRSPSMMALYCDKIARLLVALITPAHTTVGLIAVGMELTGTEAAYRFLPVEPSAPPQLGFGTRFALCFWFLVYGAACSLAWIMTRNASSDRPLPKAMGAMMAIFGASMTPYFGGGFPVACIIGILILTSNYV